MLNGKCWGCNQVSIQRMQESLLSFVPKNFQQRFKTPHRIKRGQPLKTNSLYSAVIGQGKLFCWAYVLFICTFQYMYKFLSQRYGCVSCLGAECQRYSPSRRLPHWFLTFGSFDFALWRPFDQRTGRLPPLKGRFLTSLWALLRHLLLLYILLNECKHHTWSQSVLLSVIKF